MSDTGCEHCGGRHQPEDILRLFDRNYRLTKILCPDMAPADDPLNSKTIELISGLVHALDNSIKSGFTFESNVVADGIDVLVRQTRWSGPRTWETEHRIHIPL